MPELRQTWVLSHEIGNDHVTAHDLFFFFLLVVDKLLLCMTTRDL